MSKPEVYIYEKKLKREVVTTSCVYNETLVTRIESGVYRKKGKLIVFFFKSHDDEIVPCVIDGSKYPAESSSYEMTTVRNIFNEYNASLSSGQQRDSYARPGVWLNRFINEIESEDFTDMLTRDLRKGLYTTDFPKKERKGIKQIATALSDRMTADSTIPVTFAKDKKIAAFVGMRLLNVSVNLTITDTPFDLFPKKESQPEDSVTEYSPADVMDDEESSEEHECNEKIVMETIDKFKVPNSWCSDKPVASDSNTPANVGMSSMHIPAKTELDSFIIDFVSAGNRIHFSNKKRSPEEIESMQFRFTKSQYVYYNEGVFYVNFDKFMDDLESVGGNLDAAVGFTNAIISADPEFKFMTKGRSRYYVIKSDDIIRAFVSPEVFFSESWVISDMSLLEIAETVLENKEIHVHADGIMTIPKDDFLAFYNNVRHEVFGITKKIPKSWFDMFAAGYNERCFCDENGVNIKLPMLNSCFEFAKELGMKFPNYEYEMGFLNSITTALLRPKNRSTRST